MHLEARTFTIECAKNYEYRFFELWKIKQVTFFETWCICHRRDGLTDLLACCLTTHSCTHSFVHSIHSFIHSFITSTKKVMLLSALVCLLAGWLKN